MTDQLLGARRLREITERHGIRPKKSLGQNFVIDPNTIRKVLTCAGVEDDDDVLEIGAGAGSLTLGLVDRARSVTAVEFDDRLIPVLEEVLEGVSNVTLVHADALELDLSTVTATKLVANLPYNIATPVVMRALETAPHISHMVVMTQKEVGERLVARPGTKAYGAPTVTVSYFATATIAGSVSRRAFWPVPRVDSVIVDLRRNEDRPDVAYPRFAPVVRAAFRQRRKTVRNSLAEIAGSAQEAERVLSEAGVDGSQRAEQLSLEDYLRIVRRFAKH